MLWIYRRDDQELRIEARLCAIDRQYVVRVLWPDGREQFESFSEGWALHLRLNEFESQLSEEHWIGPPTSLLNDRPASHLSEASLPERRIQGERRRLTRRDRRSGDHPTPDTRSSAPNTLPEDTET